MPLDESLTDVVSHAFGPGARVTALVDLTGSASARIYQRVLLDGAPVSSAVAMRLPPDALAPCSEPAKACSGQELPFSNVLRAARARGLRVPALYADRTREGNFTVLLEDLGDETLLRRLGRTPREQWAVLYERAIDLLVDWQRAFASPDASCVAFARRFDRELIRWELDHFREWGLEAQRGPVTAALRAALDAEFDTLADEVVSVPATWVHRDFQSTNLMVLPDGSLAVIDFQDALTGPRPYDLVALLCDSYVSLSSLEQDVLFARYAERAGLVGEGERETFRREFFVQAVQRKLKDAGRFVFLDRVRNNPNFLKYVPQSVLYAHRALRALPERARLLSVLTEIAPDWFGASALVEQL